MATETTTGNDNDSIGDTDVNEPQLSSTLPSPNQPPVPTENESKTDADNPYFSTYLKNHKEIK